MEREREDLEKGWSELTDGFRDDAGVSATAMLPRVGSVWLDSKGERVLWSAPRQRRLDPRKPKYRLTDDGGIEEVAGAARNRGKATADPVLAEPGERLASVHPTNYEVLARFARLHLLDPAEQPAEVQALVETYGPLGLCGHGKPKGHMPRRVVLDVLDDLDVAQDHEETARAEREHQRWEDQARRAKAAGKRSPRRPAPSTTTPEDRLWRQWQGCSMSYDWTFLKVKPGTKIKAIGSEAITDWVQLSAQAGALIAVGAANRRFRAAAPKLVTADRPSLITKLGFPDLADIQAIAPLLPADIDKIGFWSDLNDPDGKRRVLIGAPTDGAEMAVGDPKVIGFEPLGPMPSDAMAARWFEVRVNHADKGHVVAAEPPPSFVAETGRGSKAQALVTEKAARQIRLQRMEANIDAQQRILRTALQAWLDQGDLRVQTVMDYDTGLVRLRWGNDGLFSAIAMIMALTISGIDALAICDYCRKAHRPTTWPTSGDHLYCQDCRDSPDYAAIRKAMSRQFKPLG